MERRLEIISQFAKRRIFGDGDNKALTMLVGDMIKSRRCADDVARYITYKRKEAPIGVRDPGAWRDIDYWILQCFESSECKGGRSTSYKQHKLKLENYFKSDHERICRKRT